MPTITTPRVAVAESKPAEMAIRLRGICLDYRDTAEVRRYLATMHRLGFVSAATLQADLQPDLQRSR